MYVEAFVRGPAVRLGVGAGRFSGTTLRNPGDAYVGAVTLVDADRDGRLDIVTERDVRLGLGDGTFATPIGFPPRAGPVGLVNFGGGTLRAFPAVVVAADLNRDSDLDLIIDSSSGSGPRFLLGSGGGQFTAVPDPNVQLSSRAFVLTDTSGDGLEDYVGTVSSSSAFGIAIVRGLEDGGFDFPIWKPVPTMRDDALRFFPSRISADTEDLDGDGRMDLVAIRTFESEVRIHLGLGDGRFQAPVAVALDGDGSNVAQFVALEDVDGDGTPDLLTHGGAILNRGDRRFGTPIPFPFLFAETPDEAGRSLGPPVIADIDGDLTLDLLFPVESQSRPTSGRTEVVLLGEGDGRFHRPPDETRSPVRFTGRRFLDRLLGAGDLDGDGRTDFVQVTRLGVRTFVARTTGGFRATRPRPLVGNPSSLSDLAVHDLDLDGHADVVVTSRNGRTATGGLIPGHLTVFFGRGDGTLGEAFVVDETVRPFSVEISDVDRDGVPDLVCGASGHNSVWLGRGDRRFDGPRAFLGSGGLSVLVGDVNSDGASDIIQYGPGIGISLGRSKASCELDRDGGFDSHEVLEVLRHRGMRAVPPLTALDADGSGTIDAGDLEFCQERCTDDRCRRLSGAVAPFLNR